LALSTASCDIPNTLTKDEVWKIRCIQQCLLGLGTDDLGSQIPLVVAYHARAKASLDPVDTARELSRAGERLLQEQGMSKIQGQSELECELDVDQEVEEVTRDIVVIVWIGHCGDVPLAIGNEEMEWRARRLAKRLRIEWHEVHPEGMSRCNS
jgi:hypothetical protein